MATNKPKTTGKYGGSRTRKNETESKAVGRKKNQQPSYLLHKPSGQARVRIDGIDHYLGAHNSKESWNAYYNLLTDRLNGKAKIVIPKAADGRLTVAELVEQYIEFAKGYYGEKSPELSRIGSAIRPLDLLYATTPASEFSPRKLQAVIDRLVFEGDTRKEVVASKKHRTISRTTANDYLAVLKRIFKWAVSQELVEATIFQALSTVDGLRKGRGELSKKTHEPRKVLPVDPKIVESTIKHCQPEIAAMVQVQLLCGMRPGEVTILRPRDIERKGKVWVYRPETHKNSWRGQDKEVLIGPKAQKILKRWIAECDSADEYIFSPRKVAKRWNEQEKLRTGKDPAFVKLNAVKPPRECYDEHSYRQAVKRACKRAKLDVWTPNQLRHTAGTAIRAEFGAEASKLVLGHKHLNTTEIYAEKDRAKYAKIITKLG